jgi:hypothetical protein
MMEYTLAKDNKILELNRKIQSMNKEHKKNIGELTNHYLSVYSDLLWKYINPKNYNDIKNYVSIIMDHFGNDINFDIIFTYLKKLDEIEDINSTIQYDVVTNYDKDMTHNDKIYEVEKFHNNNESKWLALTRKIIGTFISNTNQDYVVYAGFKGKLINLHLQGESLMLERILLQKNYFLCNLCKQISKQREYNDKGSVFNMTILPSNKLSLTMLKYPTDTLISHFNHVKNKFIKNFQGDCKAIKVNIAQGGYVELYARYPSGKYIVKTNTVMANILLRFNDAQSYIYKYSEREFMKKLKLVGLIEMNENIVSINDDFTSDKIFVSTKTTVRKIEYKRHTENEKYFIEHWIYKVVKRTEKEYTWNNLYDEYVKAVKTNVSRLCLYNNPGWDKKKYVFTILKSLVERGYIEEKENGTYKYMY